MGSGQELSKHPGFKEKEIPGSNWGLGAIDEAHKVLSLSHKFCSEPVRTDRILIRNFQVGYLPNKEKTPSFFSDTYNL